MPLKEIVSANRSGMEVGIYSVCSAHPLIIEAALRQGLKSNTEVLIESTANQVNHLGGYTNMKPADFVSYVYSIADKVGFPRENIILGGDHLGPTCWTNQTAAEAMAEAKLMVEQYAKAGFAKIHLDASMPCADDEVPLSDELIAKRSVELCRVAEAASMQEFGLSNICYVIGTEVPPPGGAKEAISAIDPTEVQSVANTISLHESEFVKAGLFEAQKRVIAIVVQPGVEFDNFGIVHYVPKAAKSLKHFIKSQTKLCFEAHSTDYQLPAAYDSLIRDHFAILKVGPQLTFALREALFALSYIEEELITETSNQSNLRALCKLVMNKQPQYWKKFYEDVSPTLLDIAKIYSFSDRIRYYWNHPLLINATKELFNNLADVQIPLPLISQYMPIQYNAVLNGELEPTPKEMLLHHVMQVTNSYAKACFPK